MSFLKEHETLEVDEELDGDGELGLVIYGTHGDEDRCAWINEKQAKDLIERLKNAFAI